MNNLSVIIPVYNMGSHLPRLLASLVTTGLDRLLMEILVVDDGSTDGTLALAEDLKNKYPKLRVVRLEQNSGRFVARLKGAHEAQSDTLIFMDARIVLAEDFGFQLEKALKISDFLQPQPRIDTSRNVFCLYWDLSHRALFRRHYETLKSGPTEITPENYDRFLKGTGLLVTPKALFIDACQEVGDNIAMSDDTAIMRSMVQRKSLWLIPDAWCWWVPRETWTAFLWRLYDRGPGTVEYHVFGHRGWMFWAIMVGAVSLIAWITLLIWLPIWGLYTAVAAVGLIALSAGLFARSGIEALRIAPLHVAVIFAFGLGLIKGLVVNTPRWLRGELQWIKRN